ncbi:MAG: 23S rRNA (cytosine1962-C5)-methyltransferase [Lentimonas sp.]|jgi:23S rRNA (cytosine1962-C5)-methyltransferase
MKDLIVRENKMHSIERRHPWIFSGAIWSDTEQLLDGDIVRVINKKGECLATGHFQHGTIAVRILHFGDSVIDTSFFETKLSNSISLRKSMGLMTEENSICRVVHGEGDGLPGLIIDHYNGVFIIQCHSIGMYNSLDDIKNALVKCGGKELKAIYLKSKDTLPERLEVENKYIYGDCLTPFIALENEIKYSIDWVNGQKTGFFIDQRENRTLLGKYAKGKKVLNTFCYSGGFSLACLQQGATEVHSLDSSKTAILLTEQNLALNSFKGKHKSIVANAIEYVNNLETEEYDIIVLDPPAFAKHRDKRHKAVQGYKRLNLNAIKAIKKGGVIFTFSCSQVVDKALFTNTVIAAAIESGREVRILEQLHQPKDHPINAFHPEGEYLKGLVIQVD